MGENIHLIRLSPLKSSCLCKIVLEVGNLTFYVVIAFVSNKDVFCVLGWHSRLLGILQIGKQNGLCLRLVLQSRNGT